jgi:hypothetical protein
MQTSVPEEWDLYKYYILFVVSESGQYVNTTLSRGYVYALYVAV